MTVGLFGVTLTCSGSCLRLRAISKALADFALKVAVWIQVSAHHHLERDLHLPPLG